MSPLLYQDNDKEPVVPKEDDVMRRLRIGKYIRYLQVLKDALRNTDDEKDAVKLEREIGNILDALREMNVPASTIENSEDYYEHARDVIDNRKRKRLHFSDTPQVAFYEPEGYMHPTGIQKWTSLEEINRHKQEMQRAMTEAEKNQRWMRGGRGEDEYEYEYEDDNEHEDEENDKGASFPYIPYSYKWNLA